MIPARVQLVPIDSSILHYSGTPVAQIAGMGQVPPDVARGILAFASAVEAAGGTFRVTDLSRPIEASAEARVRYLHWLDSGEPPRNLPDGHPNPQYDPATMKDAKVAPPGYSWHNGGRAVDVTLSVLNFPNTAFDRQLDRLWDIARPLGWTPIIAWPNERASEAWHFDFRGPWERTYKIIGNREAAMAAGLDVGLDCYPRAMEKAVQAQLHRVGQNVGRLDGYIGTKTLEGLRAVGLTGRDLTNALHALYALPTAA